MNKIKTILFFLSLLFAITKIEAQQAYGLMSDSIVTNFIEDEIIAEYDYIENLTIYRDSIFKRSLKVYYKAGMYFQKVISGGCASYEQMEQMQGHLSYLEQEVIEQDERMKNLIEGSRTRLIESTFGKYKSKICREKKLNRIIDKNNVLDVDKEVIDVTKDFIILLQNEKEEVKKMFESVMQFSKSRFKRVVYKESNIISLQKYKESVGSIRIE